jgi:hypothetical protein
VSLRDDIEHALLAWDAYELDRKAPPVIDFDCAPSTAAVVATSSRLDAHADLTALHDRAERDGDEASAVRLRAHLAYLGALLGERLPLDAYLAATQGCPAAGWPEEYVTAIGDRARTALADLGVGWGSDTDARLQLAEGPVDAADLPELIRSAADDVEPAVRALAGTNAPYTLTVATVDVDTHWSSWLDGAGGDVRLRFNRRRAAFTKVRIRQLAQHELLGHALQSASYAATCERDDVSWIRLLSVHAPHQVLLEGLAQALPLFIAPDDTALVARVRLDHYLQLVRAELHRAINTGASAADCAEYARARVPWWTGGTIADALTDCGADPLLRSYLWSHPAGIDWFVTLADTAETATVEKVFRAGYAQPLTPTDLADLWPSGPAVGGPGAPA